MPRPVVSICGSPAGHSRVGLRPRRFGTIPSADIQVGAEADPTFAAGTFVLPGVSQGRAPSGPVWNDPVGRYPGRHRGRPYICCRNLRFAWGFVGQGSVPAGLERCRCSASRPAQRPRTRPAGQAGPAFATAAVEMPKGFVGQGSVPACLE
jgi:hypothetical protein